MDEVSIGLGSHLARKLNQLKVPAREFVRLNKFLDNWAGQAVEGLFMGGELWRDAGPR